RRPCGRGRWRHRRWGLRRRQRRRGRWGRRGRWPGVRHGKLLARTLPGQVRVPLAGTSACDPSSLWQGERMTSVPRVAVVPDSRPVMHDAFVAAVREGGGEVVPIADAEAIVWADPAVSDTFPDLARAATGLRWVQLPYAGIEPFVEHL